MRETLELGVMALGSMPRRSLKNGEGVVGVPVEIAGVGCLPGELLVAAGRNYRVGGGGGGGAGTPNCPPASA